MRPVTDVRCLSWPFHDLTAVPLMAENSHINAFFKQVADAAPLHLVASEPRIERCGVFLIAAFPTCGVWMLAGWNRHSPQRTRLVRSFCLRLIRARLRRRFSRSLAFTSFSVPSLCGGVIKVDQMPCLPLRLPHEVFSFHRKAISYCSLGIWESPQTTFSTSASTSFDYHSPSF